MELNDTGSQPKCAPVLVQGVPAKDLGSLSLPLRTISSKVTQLITDRTVSVSVDIYFSWFRFVSLVLSLPGC